MVLGPGESCGCRRGCPPGPGMHWSLCSCQGEAGRGRGWGASRGQQTTDLPCLPRPEPSRFLQQRGQVMGSADVTFAGCRAWETLEGQVEEACREGSDTAPTTQWGEKSLIQPHQGTLWLPTESRLLLGGRGVWRLPGRGWIKWMGGNRREAEREDGQRGRDTWTEGRREGWKE